MHMNAFTDLANVFKVIENINPWRGTPVEYYSNLNPASKGAKGEEIVSILLARAGHRVMARQNAGHDRIVDEKKTEIKFALATGRNMDYACIFNHIGLKKDWEQIIFVCVNGDGNIKGKLFQKNELPLSLLNRQQGGQSGDNDDYMVAGENAIKLLNSSNGVDIF